ncbi:MAG: hypothetical protein C0598_02835 [Marinilabiliales bacterium]|nr:MAG: hypothetical protein C0598_02835 [Marinilabiliales bacterium]
MNVNLNKPILKSHIMKTIKKLNKLKVVMSLILIITITYSANSQEFLRLYTSQPSVQATNVTGGTITTEDFSSFTIPPDNYSWAPARGGFVSVLGTYSQTSGDSYIQQDDQYGAGSGNYMAVKVGGVVNLELNNPVTYFGFAWPAGDGSNTIKILRNGAIIGTFSTSDVISLLPNNSSNTITSINGSTYTTDLYYGKPGTGQNSGEPYAYLHFYSSPGMAFDEIQLEMSNGGEFENDNHSILTSGTPVLQGDWVELLSIDVPETNDDTGSGLYGQAISVDVLDNDTPGDYAIDPTTVKISNGVNSYTTFTVTGEGIWTVNSTTGFITFTPEAGFNASPTPIEYFVEDVNNNQSNISSVTLTYFGGPTAVDDATITEKNTSVEINILNNDVAGSTAIDPTSVTFIGGTEPNPATEGTFTVNAISGLVTFTPVNNFLGQVTIDYQVCDQNAYCSTATITVDVLEGTTNLFPALGFGTLGFEDLWPSKGDYDFNDLVIDYQFEINSNIYNYVDDVVATFTIKAFGAGFENGFGFSLPDAIDQNDVTVTGSSITDNLVTLSANGVEEGQSNTTIIVYDNAYKQMEHPGSGIGVNTDPAAPYVTPVTIVINIVFTSNTYTINDLDIANFNPFIFVNKYRAQEVHLPDYPPTDLANTGLFGTADDDSDPGSDRYYKTEDNLPWAINIYESFDYPVEKQEIISAHLKFGPWAISEGTEYTDWYKDLPGYREDNLIYTRP